MYAENTTARSLDTMYPSEKTQHPIGDHLNKYNCDLHTVHLDGCVYMALHLVVCTWGLIFIVVCTCMTLETSTSKADVLMTVLSPTPTPFANAHMIHNHATYKKT